MSVLLFCHFRVTNVKFIDEKNSFIIAVSKSHGLLHSFTFFVFRLLYLSILDFNDLCKVNNVFINKITEEIQEL